MYLACFNHSFMHACIQQIFIEQLHRWVCEWIKLLVFLELILCQEEREGEAGTVSKQ